MGATGEALGAWGGGMGGGAGMGVGVGVGAGRGVSEYEKLKIRQYRSSLGASEETRFWRRFRDPVEERLVGGGVTHVSFAGDAPHHFAVTAGTRVQLHSAETRLKVRTLGRFDDVAYAGSLRADANLLVAGGEAGVVQIFDTSSRTVLRRLAGHRGAVRATSFARNNTHVFSGGDDRCARYWDVAAGACTAVLRGHTDYVRACAPVEGGNNSASVVWATGGYDHTVKLWDARTSGAGAGSDGSVLSVDHGAPVEAVAVFPSGGILVSAGGNYIRVWDLVGGGRLVGTALNHRKTVTSVAVDGAGEHVLSASLDGHVKVYDTQTLGVVHGYKCAGPVLSLGLSPDSALMAVGMLDGTVSVRRRVVGSSKASASSGAGGAGQGRAFGGGTSSAAILPPEAFRRVSDKAKHASVGSRAWFLRTGPTASIPGLDASTVVSERMKRTRLRQYDRLLRQFRYAEALDVCLDKQRPLVVTSLLEELMYLDGGDRVTGLRKALGGRTAERLLPLLKFLTRFVTNPLHIDVLGDVAEATLDIYASKVGSNASVDEQLKRLQAVLRREISVQRELRMVSGMVDMIVNQAEVVGRSRPAPLPSFVDGVMQLEDGGGPEHVPALGDAVRPAVEEDPTHPHDEENDEGEGNAGEDEGAPSSGKGRHATKAKAAPKAKAKAAPKAKAKAAPKAKADGKRKKGADEDDKDPPPQEEEAPTVPQEKKRRVAAKKAAPTDKDRDAEADAARTPAEKKARTTRSAAKRG